MRCKKESVKIREKNQEEYQTMKIIMNQTFDEERALYGSENISVKDCAFDGPADGEAHLRSAGMWRRSTAFSICGILSGTIMI